MPIVNARSFDQFSRETEGRCCDAIIRILEIRTGLLRTKSNLITNLRAVDCLKDIDIKVILGQEGYAIEHTRIITSINADRHRYFMKFRDAIKTEYFNVPGFYILCFNQTPKNILRNVGLLNTLKEWIYTAARQLHNISKEPACERKHYEITGSPIGEGFVMRLILSYPLQGLQGMLDVRQYTDPHGVKLHTKVMKALDDKLPKLSSHKSMGLTSVLALELVGSDIAFNTAYEQVVNSISSYEKLPDEIYLIDTLTSRWVISTVKFGDLLGKTLSHQTYEFDASELIDIFVSA